MCPPAKPNDNLLRIAKERANAERGLKPKKELFPESKKWLITRIGITGVFNGSYEKMREAMQQNPEDSFYRGNVAIARQQRLKRNFRSQYWEVVIVHTQPLGVIPREFMPAIKKPVQGA